MMDHLLVIHETDLKTKKAHIVPDPMACFAKFFLTLVLTPLRIYYTSRLFKRFSMLRTPSLSSYSTRLRSNQ